MKYCLLVLLAICVSCISSYAQEQDTIKAKESPFKIIAHGEIYYVYDFNRPTNNERPTLFYNYSRHNEVNLNLGFVQASYNTETMRASLGLMVGTYPQYNLVAEHDLMKNVYDASVGFKLLKNKNLWIDAGIMPSHLGFESANGRNCHNLTRSLAAENTPYFEAGAKLTYATDNDKWAVSIMYLNGWQRIKRPNDNETPAFGSQLVYNVNNKLSLYWNTFVGNNNPDSLAQWRFYNNFYGDIKFSNKWEMFIGFDYGLQQQLNDPSVYDIVMSPLMTTRYRLSKLVELGMRFEYYEDRKAIIVNAPNAAYGVQTSGASANVNLHIKQNLQFRFEVRGLVDQNKIFKRQDSFVNHNVFVGSSMIFSIE